MSEALWGEGPIEARICRRQSGGRLTRTLMKQDTVFCIAYSRIQADQMVLRLKGAAFLSRDISVVSAVGPIVAVLGDLVASLHHQGLSWVKAKLYETRIKDGRILVAVRASSDAAITQAMDVLTKAGGADVCASRDPEEQYLPELRPQPMQTGGVLNFA